MKGSLILGLISLLAAGIAVAGPNAGGAILVHVDESALTFCEIAGTGPEHSAYLPATCAQLVTRTNQQGDESSAVSWTVVAAFPPSVTPDVKGVEFGMEYANVDIIGKWTCGDFEITSPTWPASGSGVGIVFDVARTTTMFELYTFVGYSYTGSPAGYFKIIPHPAQGGPNFGDSSNPSVRDGVAPDMLGTLGFLQDGVQPCPGVSVIGACCFLDGTCLVMIESDCVAQVGVWLGVGVECDPNPCLPIPTIETTWGRIRTTFKN